MWVECSLIVWVECGLIVCVECGLILCVECVLIVCLSSVFLVCVESTRAAVGVARQVFPSLSSLRGAFDIARSLTSIWTIAFLDENSNTIDIARKVATFPDITGECSGRFISLASKKHAPPSLLPVRPYRIVVRVRYCT